jgi:DNA-directed RNA polymerase specialized sigma24 family protein
MGMPQDLEFREFFAGQFGRLRRFGFWLTGDWAQAEELAQEALVRTYRRWRWVRRYDRPEDYARKVLLNRHRSLLRRAVAIATSIVVVVLAAAALVPRVLAERQPTADRPCLCPGAWSPSPIRDSS